MFGQLCFLCQRQVDLPTIDSSNRTVGLVSEPGEESICVLRWRRKCSSIDERNAVMPPTGHSQRDSRYQVWPLAGLIVAIGKKISVCESCSGERVGRIGYGPTEVQPNGKRVPRVPHPDAAQLPASYEYAHHSGRAEISLAGS